MDKACIIPVDRLDGGRTESRFRVGKEFFEGYGNEEILDADVLASASLKKENDRFLLDLKLEGEATVQCDRCLGDLAIGIDSFQRFVVMPGSGEDDGALDEDGREIVTLPLAEAALDVSQLVYDFTCLAIPLKKVHREGECDESTTAFLSRDEEPAAEGSPFASLKDLLGPAK